MPYDAQRRIIEVPMIYFDNASTTRPSQGVIELGIRTSREFFANPASLHMQGILAEKEITASTRKLAGLLGSAASDEIVYTSGGTEANNLALFGVCEANARRGRHIITTRSEHPSVTEVYKRLEQKGFEVTWLEVDREGKIDMTSLAGAVKHDTILVSLMHVNNETGAVCDVVRAAEVVKSKNPAAVFHSDGVQAFGKLPPVKLQNIDLYSMSAHKIQGLRGIGALYVKKGTKLTPQIYGGGHQRGMRSGTENTAGICTFALASSRCHDNINENFAHVSLLKAAIANIEIEDTFINGDADGSPYILNMSFAGVKAETLVHCLEDDEIYVSTGAACGSKNSKNILEYYGIEKDRIESALRFSFSRENTLQETDALKESLIRHVRTLRGIRARR
jgi:cysteine desulfurase